MHKVTRECFIHKCFGQLNYILSQVKLVTNCHAEKLQNIVCNLVTAYQAYQAYQALGIPAPTQKACNRASKIIQYRCHLHKTNSSVYS